MILTDKVTITLKHLLDFSFQNRRYKINFLYSLDVHNYDEESALISLKTKISSHSISNQEYSILEFDEFKIPHELTVKQWISNLVFKYDSALKPENMKFEYNEELNNKIIDLLTKEFKLRNF